VLDPHHAVEKRMSAGGTGFQQVKQALVKAKACAGV
jgi:argininosuccinate lyase